MNTPFDPRREIEPPNILLLFLPQLKQMVLLQIPLGKTGEPEDIAEMAAFLASERSKYITGADIDINGGLF